MHNLNARDARRRKKKVSFWLRLFQVRLALLRSFVRSRMCVRSKSEAAFSLVHVTQFNRSVQWLRETSSGNRDFEEKKVTFYLPRSSSLAHSAGFFISSAFPHLVQAGKRWERRTDKLSWRLSNVKIVITWHSLKREHMLDRMSSVSHRMSGKNIHLKLS